MHLYKLNLLRVLAIRSKIDGRYRVYLIFFNV